MRFNPQYSLLAGMSTTQLQTQLTAMQTAYLNLVSGALGESYSYTQGDGSKSVTYTRANLPALAQAIRLVQAQLGLICAPRRALKVYT